MNLSWPAQLSPFNPRRNINTMDLACGVFDAVTQAALAATAWPAANLAMFVPVMLERGVSVTGFGWGAGTVTATNHVDVGLFAADGTKLGSTGATLLNAGNTVFQTATVTAFDAGPGLYYLGMAHDGTDSFFARALASSSEFLRGGGLYEQTTAYTLPATATFALYTRSYLPVITMQCTLLRHSHSRVTPATISYAHPLSIGVPILMTSSTGSASATWPAAKRVVYVPFRLPNEIFVKQLWVLPGATWTAGNNFDIGVYASDGTKILSTGTTHPNGTPSVLQAVTTTTTGMGPGLYYLALTLDTNTDTVNRLGTPGAAPMGAIGIQTETTGSFGLPATATFASAASAYLPYFGLSTQALI